VSFVFLFSSLSSMFMIHDLFIFMVSNQSLAKANIKRVGFSFYCCLLAFLVTLDWVVFNLHWYSLACFLCILEVGL
jgi:IS4 transposase